MKSITKKCCIRDCENKSKSRGWCKLHYERWRKNGNPLIILRTWGEGKINHPLYSTYKSMLARCNHPNHKQFRDYGGRGIKICDRWLGLDGFKHFLEDMGDKPMMIHTLDRIDNNGNYEPGNCRWATRAEQSANTRMRNDNKSGVVGVCWSNRDKRWVATITRQRKTRNLGYFKCKNQAIKARKIAETSIA